MNKAIWFSRHMPTAAQMSEIAHRGLDLVGVEEGMDLGAQSLETEEDVVRCVQRIREVAAWYGASEVFGVFPTPILSEGMCKRQTCPDDSNCLALFAAWNVMRSVDGGKPTFSHKEWQWVGIL
jgi:hypothetical protein